MEHEALYTGVLNIKILCTLHHMLHIKSWYADVLLIKIWYADVLLIKIWYADALLIKTWFIDVFHIKVGTLTC